MASPAIIEQTDVVETPSQSPNYRLVRQPNGGYIRQGGISGPGPGAPPSESRRICREEFTSRIPLLCAIADNPKERSKERILAITTLGKMGFGAHVSIEDLRERLQRQVALIQELAGPELAPTILERLAAIWR